MTCLGSPFGPRVYGPACRTSELRGGPPEPDPPPPTPHKDGVIYDELMTKWHGQYDAYVQLTGEVGEALTYRQDRDGVWRLRRGGRIIFEANGGQP